VPVKIIKEDKAEYIQALIDSREQDSLAPSREFMMEEHIRNISKEIEEYKKTQETDPIKGALDPIKSFADPINWREEKEGAIIRVESNKTGHWEINKEKTYG
jgi:hypothetical protein